MSLTAAHLENSPLNIPLKVLIADDDAPTRILLRTAIAQWGYEAVEARDGEEAWNIINKSESPKLLIVDWLMPKWDGIQLCKEIRAKLPFHPYIILLTQNTGTENIVIGLEAGADEFLTKPFKMAELRSRLSVGARIISYEDKLTAETNKTEIYLQKIQHVLTVVEENTKQLSTAEQSLVNDPQNSSNKIKEIINSLQTIKNIFTDSTLK